MGDILPRATLLRASRNEKFVESRSLLLLLILLLLFYLGYPVLLRLAWLHL